MSTINPEPQPTTEPAEPQAEPQPTTETEPAEPEQDEGTGKEAAKYRRRLRDTEVERDGLASRIETLQRAEVERLAGHLTRPSAIWAAGTQLPELLDDGGNIDPAKVDTAIGAAAEALGLARAPRTPRPDPSQGGANSSGPTGPKFSDAFSPGRR